MIQDQCSAFRDLCGSVELADRLLEAVRTLPPSDPTGVFAARAIALASAMAPVLAWTRREHAIGVDHQILWTALQLRSLNLLTTRRTFLHRERAAGPVRELSLRQLPGTTLHGGYKYLDSLPGYDPRHDDTGTDNTEAATIHNLSLFYFTPALLRPEVTAAGPGR